MIIRFGDSATEDMYHGRPTSRARRFPRDVACLALLKLDMLDSAASLLDLRSPPGNRLDLLKGETAGRYSIRMNLQWRLVFRWDGHNAHDVRLMDYHG